MKYARILGFALGLLAIGTWPAAAYKDDEKPRPQAVVDAERAMKAGDFQVAVDKLTPYLATDPINVDALADLGKSKLELRDTDAALRYLEKALALEPSKLDKNLWLGQAYLTKGMLPQAEERLKRLSRACFFGCSEEHKLKELIAAYKASH